MNIFLSGVGIAVVAVWRLMLRTIGCCCCCERRLVLVILISDNITDVDLIKIPVASFYLYFSYTYLWLFLWLLSSIQQIIPNLHSFVVGIFLESFLSQILQRKRILLKVHLFCFIFLDLDIRSSKQKLISKLGKWPTISLRFRYSFLKTVTDK